MAAVHTEYRRHHGPSFSEDELEGITRYNMNVLRNRNESNITLQERSSFSSVSSFSSSIMADAVNIKPKTQGISRPTFEPAASAVAMFPAITQKTESEQREIVSCWEAAVRWLCKQQGSTGGIHPAVTAGESRVNGDMTSHVSRQTAYLSQQSQCCAGLTEQQRMHLSQSSSSQGSPAPQRKVYTSSMTPDRAIHTSHAQTAQTQKSTARLSSLSPQTQRKSYMGQRTMSQEQLVKQESYNKVYSSASPQTKRRAIGTNISKQMTQLTRSPSLGRKTYASSDFETNCSSITREDITGSTMTKQESYQKVYGGPPRQGSAPPAPTRPVTDTQHQYSMLTEADQHFLETHTSTNTYSETVVVEANKRFKEYQVEFSVDYDWNAELRWMLACWESAARLLQRQTQQMDITLSSHQRQMLEQRQFSRSVSADTSMYTSKKTTHLVSSPAPQRRVVQRPMSQSPVRRTVSQTAESSQRQLVESRYETEIDMYLKERRMYSETIIIEAKRRFKEFQIQFSLSDWHEEIKDIKYCWEVAAYLLSKDYQTHISTLNLQLQQDTQIEQEQSMTTQLNQKLIYDKSLEEKQFSETIAIQEPAKPVVVTVKKKKPKVRRQRPKKAVLEVCQDASMQGYKMEVEIDQQEIEKKTSHVEILMKQKATAVETQRNEMTIDLHGMQPRFTIELTNQNVMDGEKVSFVTHVVGNPAPEITWYKNGKVVIENPDFYMTYEPSSGDVALHILEVFPQDTGEYQCVATNKYGRAVNTCTLNVEVYEYIQDSEEASCVSAAPSEKEIETIEDVERTHAFIANLQKLQQELQEEKEEEEVVEMTEDYEEETIQLADVKWKRKEQQEIIERTEAFIANLQKLKQELKEEKIAEKEIEMLEEEEEEIVQMADVSWQIKKQGQEMHIEVEVELVEESEDRVPSPEGARVEEVIVNRIQSLVEAAKGSLVLTLEEAQPLEITHDCVDARIPSPGEALKELVTVELTQPMQQDAPGAMIQPQHKDYFKEFTEESIDRIPSAQETNEEHIVVTLNTTMQENAPAKYTLPVEEHNTPEFMGEFLCESPNPAVEEQIVHIEMQVGDKRERLPQRAETVYEPIEVNETQHASCEFVEEDSKKEEVVVLLDQAWKEEAKPSVAQDVEEVIIIEDTQDSIQPLVDDGADGQEIFVPLDYHECIQAIPSSLDNVMENVEIENTLDNIEALVDDGIEGMEVIVPLDNHDRMHAIPSCLDNVIENIDVEDTQDDVEPLVDNEIQHEEIIVLLDTHILNHATPSLHEMVNEDVEIEDTQDDIQELIDDQAGSEEIFVPLDNHDRIQAIPSSLDNVVENIEIEDTKDDIESLVDEGIEGQEIFVPLDAHDRTQAIPSLLNNVIEEIEIEDTQDDIDALVDEGIDGQDVIVSLDKHVIIDATPSVLDIVEEEIEIESTEDSIDSLIDVQANDEVIVVLLERHVVIDATPSLLLQVDEEIEIEDTKDDIEALIEEFSEGYDIIVYRDYNELTHATPSTLDNVVETIDIEEVQDDIEALTEEEVEHDVIQVLLERHELRDATPSLLDRIEEIIDIEDVKDDIVALVDDGADESVIDVKLDNGEVTARPDTLLAAVDEEVPIDDVIAWLDDSIREARVVPCIYQPQTEPISLEWLRIDVRVHPGILRVKYHEMKETMDAFPDDIPLPEYQKRYLQQHEKFEHEFIQDWQRQYQQQWHEHLGALAQNKAYQHFMDEENLADQHAEPAVYSPDNSPPYTTPLTSPPPETLNEQPPKEGGCKQS